MRSRSKLKGRAVLKGTFLMIPTEVLMSENFCALSMKAKALVTDMGARYNGYNNGDLAIPWSWMKKRGWKSKDTLQRATEELIRYGIIEKSSQGGRHRPNLFAFSWLPIQSCKRWDVKATTVASALWKIPVVVEKKKNLPRRSGSAAPTVGTVDMRCTKDSPPSGGVRRSSLASLARPSGTYKTLPCESVLGAQPAS